MIAPTRPSFRVTVCLLAVAVLASVAACVKIERGTPAEASENADWEASNRRTAWANRILDATPLEVAKLLVDHVETVSRSYTEYGHQVAAEWEQGERDSGRAIPGSEMREVIAGWTAGERAAIQANEDNLEYAFARIRELAYFDEAALAVFKTLVDSYYTAYNAVFLPSGELGAYNDGLWDAERAVKRAVDDVRQELSRY